MSRIEEGWDEDFPNQWALIERATRNAIHGKKGQALLKELEQALLAMPVKELITSRLADEGACCTLGAMLVHRKVCVDGGITYAEAQKLLEATTKKFYANDESGLTEDDTSGMARFCRDNLGMAKSMVWRIILKNDERFASCTPAERWTKMLEWVRANIFEGKDKPDKFAYQ